MGLADKLAAQKAAKQAAGAPQQSSQSDFASQQQNPQPPSQSGYQQQQQGPYTDNRPPPQQQMYGHPSSPQGVNHPLQPPQSSYAMQQYQPQNQIQYQQPQTAYQPLQQQNKKFPRSTINHYREFLQKAIEEKKLQHWYPESNPSRLDEAAKVVWDNIEEVSEIIGIDSELAEDLARLTLFDTIVFIDNSGSMKQYKDRFEDLRAVMSQAVDIVRRFDSDGIDVRFMNDEYRNKSRDNVKDDHTINDILEQKFLFHGQTPLGTQLKSQILEKVVSLASAGRLPKPVQVITITDGKPNYEPDGALRSAIQWATDQVARTAGGSGTISFQFAQVGNDEEAQKFLNSLDKDPVLRHLIDTTSNFETEGAQVLAKNGEEMEVGHWILKLLVGAVDPSYDRKDEASSNVQVQGAFNTGYQAQYQAPNNYANYGPPAPYRPYNPQQFPQGGSYPNNYAPPSGYPSGSLPPR